MLTQVLRSKVDQLWNRFWSGGIANPLTAIEQISYLLFMRRLDALDEKRRGDAEFLKEAEARGLSQLKGHRAVGGMRASIYNAMPVEGVRALVEFMRDFERTHG